MTMDGLPWVACPRPRIRARRTSIHALLSIVAQGRIAPSPYPAPLGVGVTTSPESFLWIA